MKIVEPPSLNEKRQFARVKNSLPIYYESIVTGSHGNGLTCDLSENGVRISVEEFIPVATLMSLKISLKPDTLVELNAHVRWSQRVAYSSRYQLGLRFADPSPQLRRSFRDYVVGPTDKA